MANKEKEIIATAAQNIYGDVTEILGRHTIRENPADDPRIDPHCLEALCCELDVLFTDKYGVDTQRKLLNNYTWDEIKAIADAGKAADVFKVGDTKDIELYTGEKITLVIVGFNHDDRADGKGKAAITFATKDVIDGDYEMNDPDAEGYSTNVGGWNKSKMRNVYLPRYYKLLPAELRNVIIPVTKTTGEGGGSTETFNTVDDLFLFSKVEVGGGDYNTAAGEGEQYEYYKDDEKRIKSRGGSAYSWWLRSPNVANAYSFWCVGSDGYVVNNLASSSCGVSFGFCI